MRGSLFLGVFAVVLVTACQDDLTVHVTNGCDSDITFFMYEASDSWAFSEEDLNGPVRLSPDQRKSWSAVDDAERFEIYNSSLNRVTSVAHEGGDDVDILVDTGCDALRARDE